MTVTICELTSPFTNHYHSRMAWAIDEFQCEPRLMYRYAELQECSQAASHLEIATTPTTCRQRVAVTLSSLPHAATAITSAKRWQLPSSMTPAR